MRRQVCGIGEMGFRWRIGGGGGGGGGGEGESDRIEWLKPFNKSLLKKTLLEEGHMPVESPALANNPKHIVVVMDGMKGFTMAPLEWALKNLIADNCTVTLLGVMPWLNIPLSSKIWLDVWPVEIKNLLSLQERNKWRNDVRYLKLQAIIGLCRRYGVVPQKEVVMGYPTKLLVVEKITSLHATWVVFDRHQRKNREFYAERILCNMVMMNENGEGDMIKGRCIFDNIEGPSASVGESTVPTLKVLLSEQLREILREKIKEEQDKEGASVSSPCV